MKKQLYDKMIDAIRAQPKLYSTHKVTYKEGLEVHTFGHLDNKDLVEAKALFKAQGYGVGAYTKATELSAQGKLLNTYLTILYGADTDKISIALFDIGYAYAGRKQRFYPVRKNTPVFAWTKHMYNLMPMGRSRTSIPRIQLSNINLYGYFPQIGDVICKILLNVDYIPSINVSYRHILNTKNDWEALENYVGKAIPEELKIFHYDHLIRLYKTIKDPSEIDRLAQYCKIYYGSRFKTIDWRGQRITTLIQPCLFEMIGLMIFGHYEQDCLIGDYISTSISLKKKELSLEPSCPIVWQERINIMYDILRLKAA